MTRTKTNAKQRQRDKKGFTTTTVTVTLEIRGDLISTSVHIVATLITSDFSKTSRPNQLRSVQNKSFAKRPLLNSTRGASSKSLAPFLSHAALQINTVNNQSPFFTTKYDRYDYHDIWESRAVRGVPAPTAVRSRRSRFHTCAFWVMDIDWKAVIVCSIVPRMHSGYIWSYEQFISGGFLMDVNEFSVKHGVTTTFEYGNERSTCASVFLSLCVLFKGF